MTLLQAVSLIASTAVLVAFLAALWRLSGREQEEMRAHLDRIEHEDWCPDCGRRCVMGGWNG